MNTDDMSRDELLRYADTVDREFRKWLGRSANAARIAGYDGPLAYMLRKADALRAKAATI